MNASHISAIAPAPATVEPAPMYEPLDFVLVRAPLAPIERYFELSDEGRQLALASDPRAARALAAASPSLLAALERSTRQESGRRERDRMHAKLLRYQIRMSTRPTPFGLFAGVALAGWGDRTDLLIESTTARIRTRPDMAWLMALVASAESKPAIRRRLNVTANPLATIDGGRAVLAEPAPTAGRVQREAVSIRATGVVRHALALARATIAYTDLARHLLEAAASASAEKVDALLTQLCEQTFLITDLRPPLTIDEPARYVIDRLRPIPDADELLARLERFVDAAANWDGLDHAESVPAFKSVLTAADVPLDGSRETPVQVDMALAVAGRVGRLVALEAAAAARILLRLSPAPRGLSHVAAYRQAFVSRYGHDREVPLLELLSPARGLGPMSLHGHAGPSLGPEAASRRAHTLQQLACVALRDRSRVVMLGEQELARLETWRPEPDSAPGSIDLNVLVGARSAAAIDRGEFLVVIGPNLGALAAGRNLARFADLLGDGGRSALWRAAEAESATRPDQLCVELVYLPANLRSANVVIRPPVREFEVVFGASPGVPASRVVPLDELVVGVDRERFYVRWPQMQKRVNVTSGHMLNNHHAPAVARFLVDIGLDNRAILNLFDWGPAETFPFLPRAQAGRIVLRPAQWRIQKEDLTASPAGSFRGAFEQWRSEWDAPRYVCLSVGDNRLVLDLDCEMQVQQVRAELEKLQSGGALVLQEVCPALDEAWLEGPDGHYYSELTISLALRQDGQTTTAPKPVTEDAAAGKHRTEPPRPQVTAPPTPSPAIRRVHPPGGEWLFLKLYGPRGTEDDLITDLLATLTDNAIAAGLADSWFFIRYADPEPHLRLRFHGARERLVGHLFAHVCEWAERLMTDGIRSKFMLDAYEQEIERFGGPAAMEASEAVFFADSRAAVQLLRARRSKLWPHDDVALAALSVDDLLAGLGYTASDRLAWYRAQVKTEPADVGTDYRRRKPVLRTLLGSSPQEEAPSRDIQAALQARRGALASIADRLRVLIVKEELTQSLDTLSASYVHLHLNRLGLDASLEPQILGLLARTRESLAKAPLPS